MFCRSVCTRSCILKLDITLTHLHKHTRTTIRTYKNKSIYYKENIQFIKLVQDCAYLLVAVIKCQNKRKSFYVSQKLSNNFIRGKKSMNLF